MNYFNPQLESITTTPLIPECNENYNLKLTNNNENTYSIKIYRLKELKDEYEIDDMNDAFIKEMTLDKNETLENALQSGYYYFIEYEFIDKDNEYISIDVKIEKYN